MSDPREERPTRAHLHHRVDIELVVALRAMAQRQHTTQVVLLERALRMFLGKDRELGAFDGEPSTPAPNPAKSTKAKVFKPAVVVEEASPPDPLAGLDPTRRAMVEEMQRKDRAWEQGDGVTSAELDAAIAQTIQGMESWRDNAKWQSDVTDKLRAQAEMSRWAKRLRNLQARKKKQ